MANTSSRMLRLLTLLQTHRFWPGPELAAKLGVTGRTLRRDIDRLRELGYPVRSSRGTDGGYQLAAGASMPPLVVDAEEAVAIVVALRAATQGAAAMLGDAPIRALAKVMQVLPKPLRRRADAVRHATVTAGAPEAPAVDLDLLTTVAQCCRDRVRLEFHYVARDGARSQRRTDPYHLVPLGRRWYLVAFDRNRADWRSFRLDRMSDARTTTIPTPERTVPGDDPAEFVRSGLRNVDRDHVVTLEVEAAADAVTAEIGQWATIVAAGTHRCRVTITANRWFWIAVVIASIPYPTRIMGGDDNGELQGLLQDWASRLKGIADDVQI